MGVIKEIYTLMEMEKEGLPDAEQIASELTAWIRETFLTTTNYTPQKEEEHDTL